MDSSFGLGMILVAWIAACGAIAIIASEKGRAGSGWFFMSLFLSPLFGVLLLNAAPTRMKTEENKPKPNELSLK